MPTAQIFLDLYVETYFKDNTNENEADVRKRLSDVLCDTNNESKTASAVPTSIESE